MADLEGGSPVEVASGPMGWGVDWSPDGSRIVFSSREKRQNGTYWVSSDGSEEGMIAPFTPGAGKTPEPPPSLIGGCDQRDEQGVAQPGKGCASPDGRFIAFSGVLLESGRAPTTSLVVVDSAAGTQTDITPEGVQPEQGRPAWSPDGRNIAFRGSDSDGCWLYTIASDGSDLKRVVSLRSPTTCSCEGDVSVLWSPDGQYLYYTKGAISSEGCAPGFPYRVRVDGSDERQLADLRAGGLYGFAP